MYVWSVFQCSVFITFWSQCSESVTFWDGRILGSVTSVFKVIKSLWSHKTVEVRFCHFFCLLMECTNNYGSRSSRTKNLNECGKLGFLYGNFYLVYYFDSSREVHWCSCAESPARLAGWESNPWLVLSLFSWTYSLLELKSLKGQEPESTINYLAGSKSAFRILNPNQS